jgi:hypothetical protein
MRQLIPAVYLKFSDLKLQLVKAVRSTIFSISLLKKEKKKEKQTQALRNLFKIALDAARGIAQPCSATY